MPLTAPPDNTKTWLALSIGVGIIGSIVAITRYTYPVAGDNQHRFPFGGCYRDGTKTALYNKPNLPGHHSFGISKLEALLAVFIISLLIIYLTSRKSKVCHVCGRPH